MPEATVTCPRCFYVMPITAEVKFCPHCGLADAMEAALDTAPLNVTAGETSCRVFERLAVGSICTIYRCEVVGKSAGDALFKIARDSRANAWVSNESAVLRVLQSADRTGQFTPFFPQLVDSISVADGSKVMRQANILRLHPEVGPPEALYTLEEVRTAHPEGLDQRDVAWIWRRLLNVLGFAQTQDVIHGAVLPMHVLIEPAGHKLVLVDWCGAVHQPRNSARSLAIISAGHRAWYRREISLTDPPLPALDVALGARCMIELLGGDALSEEFPDAVDPAIQRHFQRCLGSATGKRPDAWKLLEDFDRLIETLWGPRKFRVLNMPPKSRLS